MTSSFPPIQSLNWLKYCSGDNAILVGREAERKGGKKERRIEAAGECAIWVEEGRGR